MNFQDISNHITGFGCTIDHFEGDAYYASNCITGQICLIEDLQVYSTPTICHYCFELAIPVPADLVEESERYREFREQIAINRVIDTDR